MRSTEIELKNPIQSNIESKMNSGEQQQRRLLSRDEAEDFVEGGSTLSDSVAISSRGGVLGTNPSPFSSMNDLLRRPPSTSLSTAAATQQQQQVHVTAASALSSPQQHQPSRTTTSSKKNYHGSTTTTTITTTTTMSYGAPTSVQMSGGNFPAVGSTLGPFFSVGKLGKGTFCSIHKCINLAYFHNNKNYETDTHDDDDDDDDGQQFRNDSITTTTTATTEKKSRLAAAKVEIGEFVNSGILGGEAAILHFLHSVLDPHTVPIYMGHYQATATTTTNTNNNNESGGGGGVDNNKEDTGVKERRQSKGGGITNNSSSTKNMVSAIVMEYLPGQDMHVIRDWATKQNQQSSGGSSSGSNRLRRVSVQDAVFLTAKIMLPLLQRMHSVGIVHRDVKPSNVVKRGGTDTSKDFCVVDFGLSKSVVVPQDSSMADTEHAWNGKDWMKTVGMNVVAGQDAPPAAAYRRERESADFRGTSMYASVPVHQLKDYSPRDDIWSLMYVFCDLVSGGLPWMSHAASRDRTACQKIKQRIHGMEAQADGEVRNDTKRLLMGDEYHVALYRMYKGGIDPPEEKDDDEKGDGESDNEPMPQPLQLSNDTAKVQLLEKAFEHLKQLQFTDMPDYDLIRSCLEGFLEDGNPSTDSGISPIDWKTLSTSLGSRAADDAAMETESPLYNGRIPIWDFQEEDDRDPLELENPDMFPEADFVLQNTPDEEQGDPLTGEETDLARLPLEMRFRIAQMDFNIQNKESIEPHLALRDWLKVALPLLYGSWDSAKYERGGHRFSDDGYRRENYLRILGKCIDCAATFQGFRSKSCFYHNEQSSTEPQSKRRKVLSTMRGASSDTNTNGESSSGSDLITVSKVTFELRMVKKAEEILPRAPPPRLSFGAYL